MTHLNKPWFAWVAQCWRGPCTPIKRQPKILSRLKLELLEERAMPATITVNSIGDTILPHGKVTLREAITSIDNGADDNKDVTANRVGNYGVNDTIIFNIGNGNQQIAIQLVPLPTITKTVIIDGTPPPDSTQTIELNGAALQKGGNAIEFEGANGSQVYGLTVDGFQSGQQQNDAGIVLNDTANARIGASNGMLNSRGNAIVNGQGEDFIDNNFIGIDITGAQSTGDSVIASFIGTNTTYKVTGNNSYGVYLENGATGNTIEPGSLGNANVGNNGVNVISYNDIGVKVAANAGANNTIAGNLIGTDATGTNMVKNSAWGVEVYGGNNTMIGGQAVVNKGKIITPVNVISGNASGNVELVESTNLVSVQGNYIGTDVNGTQGIGTLGGPGVELMGASGARIGGTQPSQGNVISGNNGDGIEVSNGSQNNRIQDNWIGTTRDGKTALGNNGWGVNYGGANTSGNIVKGNVIANNFDGGVNDPFKQNKTVDPNSIIGNDGPGIYTDGTYNGSPDVTSATVSNGNMTIQGTLSSTPNSSFILEFFGDENAVTPGDEQGEVFLGTITVTTDANGNAAFAPTFNSVYGNYVSATATGTGATGYTSQFSAYVSITGASSLATASGVVWNDLN